MTLVKLNFETGTAGSNVVVGADSGFDVVTLNGGSTLTYSVTHAEQGTKSAQVGTVASAATLGQVSGLSTPRLAVETAVWLDTAPTADTWLTSLLDTGTGTILKVAVTSTSRLKVIGPGTVTLWTSTNAIPFGQWVRLSLYAEVNGATGTVRFSYFSGNGTTPLETGYTANNSVDLGSLNINYFRVGKCNASDYASPFWFDAVQYDAAATGFIGPWVDNPTNGAFIWNGTTWELYSPHMWNGTSWDEYDNIL
jgi:hypothetical protein